jgi:DNA-3-methyladenine glycosylase I
MTNLRKRENYRRAFDIFDPAKVAAYGEAKIEELLQNPGIIRNRQKINSAIRNAEALLRVQEEFGSFEAYIWGFVDGKPIQNSWQTMSELPAKTELSDIISKDLKKRGFSFVGPTIVYAFMQAVGIVNDHTVDCFRYHEVGVIC